jgi:PAS domain S-box-containing protein
MVPISPEDPSRSWAPPRPRAPLPVTGTDELLTLSARVHESVAAVQQALLWGFDVHECLTLAIDALLEISGSAWGAVAVVSGPSGDVGAALRLDVPRSARIVNREDDAAWLAAVATHLVMPVRQALDTRTAVAEQLCASGSEPHPLLGLGLDQLVALPVPGATSASRVVVLARRGLEYDATLVAGLDPLIRLQGQMDAWAGEVEARRAAERALAQERRRLELALAASNVGVIEFDPATGALQWDERVWAMHGVDPREPWSLPDWAGLLHPDDAHRTLADLMAALGQVASMQTQHRIVRPDGDVRHIRLHVRTFTDAERLRIVGVSTDVTADVRLQEELARERAQAEAATQAKSQFLATMSHEIRTPMNGVLGMLELLLRDGLSSEQRSRAETAHASAACLLRILDDILDLSKLESHQVSIEAIPFEPGRIVAETVALLQPRVAEKGLRLVAEVDAALPAWLSGDPTRVRQVLLNLAGNAVKFTTDGLVSIDVRMRRDDRTGPRWRVAVTDTGEGIAADVQPRLFQQFVQADSSTTRRFGGSGLGLAISRQLVELMGGSIGVTSRLGHGSTFWFELPAPAVDAPAPVSLPAPDVTPAPGTLPALQVLAVDDNAVNRRVVHAFLKTGGHVCTLAEGGEAALALITERSFDVVLMDVQMPVMDGPACLRRIRALDGPMRQVPVIAVTANAMAGDRERYLAAGFDEYVSKPMTLQSLMAAITCVYRGAAINA